MITHSDFSDDVWLKSRKEDERLFQLICIVTFPLFLLASVVARMRPERWTFVPREKQMRRSLLAEAAAATRSTIATAFMD
jgi:hypothetical protein